MTYRTPRRVRAVRAVPPSGLFQGVNFMTPNILGYYRLRDGAYAELSEGLGMNRQPIFGVTVRPEGKHRRSKMCHSKAEALDYIERMS